MSIVLNLQVENYYKNYSFRPDRSFIIPDTTKTAIFQRQGGVDTALKQRKSPETLRFQDLVEISGIEPLTS